MTAARDGTDRGQRVREMRKGEGGCADDSTWKFDSFDRARSRMEARG